MTYAAYNNLGQAEARECYEYWQAEQRAIVKLFYDLTDGKVLSNDPEGNLVALCALHAAEYDDDILLASSNADGMGCELCAEEAQS